MVDREAIQKGFLSLLRQQGGNVKQALRKSIQKKEANSFKFASFYIAKNLTAC